MNRRYVIVQGPERQWAIIDQQMSALCSLPDEEGNRVPMVWAQRHEAQAWLYMCRVAWGADLIEGPEGWQQAA